MTTETEVAATSVMGSLVETMANLRRIENGDIVEGNVVAIEGTSVYVELAPYGTGIIFGREFIAAKDILKNTSIGDTIKAKVVEKENEDGYIELSLQEAKQALLWKEADDMLKNKTELILEVKEANKGGLLINWQGISGFLPASQLSTDHYPRVADGDKDLILKELKNLVDTKIAVTIIGVNPKEGKLIFSEKGKEKEERKELITKYSVGDEAECEVTGTTEFGVFLKLEEGLEGLVHISEIDWSLVEDPRKLFKLGEKIKAKVIEIKGGKVSLSIKALKGNPWKDAADKYKKDQEVTGVVIKHNKHGALVAIEQGVAGLIHVSDFDSETKLRETLEIGKTYPFKINLFEPKDQKMTLSFAGAAK
jgi:small subunit ribosomal protein S1